MKYWVDTPPPANALRVTKWADLPMVNDAAVVEISHPNGSVTKAKLSAKTLRVLLGLVAQPIKASSEVRIGHYTSVMNNKNDQRHLGDHIDCEMHKSESDGDDFGIFHLRSRVQFNPDEGAA